MGYFDKTAGVNTLSGKFKYIKDHFTYWPFNSWNGGKNIANKVKVDEMGLDRAVVDKVFEMMDADNEGYWFHINDCLEYECEDRGLKVGFNGRSAGYLVLYSPDKYHPTSLLGEYWNYDSYRDWLADYADGDDYRAAQADLRYMIERDFDVVQKFDQLCDNMRENLIYMAENYEIEEESYTVVKTVKRLVIA